MLYMVTFTINIPQMLAYIPYMDPMGHVSACFPQNRVARYILYVCTHIFGIGVGGCLGICCHKLQKVISLPYLYIYILYIYIHIVYIHIKYDYVDVYIYMYIQRCVASPKNKSNIQNGKVLRTFNATMCLGGSFKGFTQGGAR
jgi:hypothetical protein